MSTLLFEESQRFAGVMELTFSSVILVLLVVFWFRRRQVYSKVIWGIIIFFYTVIVLDLFAMRLSTRYYSDRIEYQFVNLFPVQYDVLQVGDMEKVEMITYNPSNLGLGTNGLSYAPMHGAGRGIIFTLKNGKYLMLAAEQPDSLFAHVKNYYPFGSSK